ncbi:MAG TPA: PEGA domain-containing protein [Candidatus Eisenbacteria bacterium]|nr:PEGA domain-containing protein [Candidatus Eisenbacteria bacterium]
MKAELGVPFRIVGLARSPDHEGALAHLDPDRGFALCTRGSMGPTDVVDPTIWVKEKLSVALGIQGALQDSSDPALRRIIGAMRALHAELMSRPESERPWLSVMVLLLLGEDAVAISAGDCPCFRFRSGLLSRLGRVEPDLGPRPPRGALGSEPQVRIEVVPLRPQPGDVYVLSTRALREGELAVLARDLALARSAQEILLAGADGSPDRGRLAVRVLEPTEDSAAVASVDTPAWTEAHGSAPSPQGQDPSEWGGLAIEPIAPESPADPVPQPPASTAERASSVATVDERASGTPGFLSESNAGAEPHEPSPVQELPPIEIDARDFVEPAAGEAHDASVMTAETTAPPSPEPAPPLPAPERPRFEPSRFDSLAPVSEEKPWHEPLALWAGGALAIVALAFLIRSLVPGILGSPKRAGVVPPAVATATGLVDIFSDPPGATVRVDGVPLEGKTPLTGVSLETGAHRLELDWGVYGVWRDTVEVSASSRLTVHPALHGSVSLVSSEPSRPLDVYVDGVYAGTTPLALDKVGVGKHLIRFAGPGITASTREIDVLRDRSIEIVGSVGAAPAKGALTVRSATLGEAGFESAKGDPFWIDGIARGVTPATVELEPGTHSVRVARRNYPPRVSVLDVKSGGESFVTAEFGASTEEPLRFDPPEAISTSDPSPLTLAVPPSEWDPSVSLWLYAAPPGGTFQAKRMTRLEEGSRSFAALVPNEVLQNSTKKVRIYFKATGTAGRENYSEIYTIPVRD